MSGSHLGGCPTLADICSFLGFLDDVAVAVDALYAMGELEAAESLSVILADLEALPADTGDFEAGDAINGLYHAASAAHP